MSSRTSHGERPEDQVRRVEKALRAAVHSDAGDDPAALDRVFAASRVRLARARPRASALRHSLRLGLVVVIAVAAVASAVVAVARSWTPAPDYVVQRALAALAQDARAGGIMHEVTTVYDSTGPTKGSPRTVTEAWSTVDGDRMRVVDRVPGSDTVKSTTIVIGQAKVQLANLDTTKSASEGFGAPSEGASHYHSTLARCQYCHDTSWALVDPEAPPPSFDPAQARRLTSVLSGSVETLYRWLLVRGRWEVAGRRTVGDVPVWVLRAPSPVYGSGDETLEIYVDQGSYLPLGMTVLGVAAGEKTLAAWSRTWVDRMPFPPGLPIPNEWFELPKVPAGSTGGYRAWTVGSALDRYQVVPVYWLGPRLPAQLTGPSRRDIAADRLLATGAATRAPLADAAAGSRSTYEIVYESPSAPSAAIDVTPRLSLTSIDRLRPGFRHVETTVAGRTVVLELDLTDRTPVRMASAYAVYVQLPEGLTARVTMSHMLGPEEIRHVVESLRRAN